MDVLSHQNSFSSFSDMNEDCEHYNVPEFKSNVKAIKPFASPRPRLKSVGELNRSKKISKWKNVRNIMHVFFFFQESKLHKINNEVLRFF